MPTTTLPTADPTETRWADAIPGDGPSGLRLGYLTDDRVLFAAAQRYAAAAGHALRWYAPADPLPEPDAVDGLLVDLDRPVLDKSARARKLAALAKFARSVAVVAHGLRTTYPEANLLRGAGVKTYPTLRPAALAALAARATPTPAPSDPSAETVIDLPALSPVGPVRVAVGRG